MGVTDNLIKKKGRAVKQGPKCGRDKRLVGARLLLQTGKEDYNIMFPNHAKSHRIDRMDFFLIIVKSRAPPLARAPQRVGI